MAVNGLGLKSPQNQEFSGHRKPRETVANKIMAERRGFENTIG
jgi:hypothetical protein